MGTDVQQNDTWLARMRQTLITSLRGSARADGGHSFLKFRLRLFTELLGK